MAEWSNAAVLKTVDGANRPGVRIPPSPPNQKEGPISGLFFLIRMGDEDFRALVRLGSAI